jgi:hypothetical protein
MQTRIMYMEKKGVELSGPARIGRVRFSRSGRTLYYAGKAFQSLGGRGSKANFFECGFGDDYWISGCRRDGADRLYPGIVEIDDDVRDEYWRTVRGRSDAVGLSSFRSEGKDSKRRPR